MTRALIKWIRRHGKLFLDEMDEPPSWKWINKVDSVFALTDVAADVAVIRRNVLESYTRGWGCGSITSGRRTRRDGGWISG